MPFTKVLAGASLFLLAFAGAPAAYAANDSVGGSDGSTVSPPSQSQNPSQAQPRKRVVDPAKRAARQAARKARRQARMQQQQQGNATAPN